MAILNTRELKWMRCKPEPETRAELRNWYQKTPGIWLEEDEKRLLDHVLPTLFGYYLLQLGVTYADECLSASKIPNHMVMDIDHPDCINDIAIQDPKNIRFFRGKPERLPVASDSLDVLVLPHTLEFTSDPHEILREADRVLIPEGHVVILGFNPWGLWMLWRMILGWRRRPPWCGRFMRYSRLKDWLQLLGFDVVESHGYFFRPPLTSRRLMKRLSFLERIGQKFWPFLFLSGAYIIVAKKRVATLTPIRPRWRPRRSRLIAPELAGNSSVSNFEEQKKAS